jgi:hypothetical protein
MIEEACADIERVEERARRAREVKYGRRNKIRYIDRLLNELEMLNLADQSEVPQQLAGELEKLMAETTLVAAAEQPRLETVSDAMDLLYEIQDSLMFNEDEPD